MARERERGSGRKENEMIKYSGKVIITLINLIINIIGRKRG